MACRSPAVVCCRCSPTQKAQVVTLIKKHTGKRTAAVGDGGNDVSMIQAADTGLIHLKFFFKTRYLFDIKPCVRKYVAFTNEQYSVWYVIDLMKNVSSSRYLKFFTYFSNLSK